MLIEFQVGNYKSFKDPVLLSMIAAKPIKEHREDNAFHAGKFNLLKCAAIYGANASGKSNLLDALIWMRWFVLNSSRETQATERIAYTPFRLDAESETQPSRFEVRFHQDGKTYRYGFEVNDQVVSAEWLFRAGPGREVPLFLRLGDEIEVRSGFSEAKGLEAKTRPNALFLSVAAQFNGATASLVLRWFQSVRPIHGLQVKPSEQVSLEMLGNPDSRGRLLGFLKAFDLDIEDLVLRELPLAEAGASWRTADRVAEAARIRPAVLTSVHKKALASGGVGQAELDFFRDESEGTKKLFALAGPILACLESGAVAVIDELDSRLHPLLTRALVRLFNSKETNPKNAQLIFTTHDTNLLQVGGLRRDQIWLVEKTPREVSTLYSLVEFKLETGRKARKDADLRKNYLAGSFGAVPYVQGLTALLDGGVDA